MQTSNPVPRPGWGTILFVIGVLAAALVLALAHSGTPAPPSRMQAVDAFSAQRALVDLRQIARAPHPVGTPANADVRAYLLARLQALGLTTEVQTGIGIMPQPSSAARLHNIVARLRGRARAPALLLAAHYDSAPTSLGAADDGASVAALLETLRALRSGPSLERDIVVLITDGEELGLLGARLFTAQHLLAKEAGIVLNFEYRGNAGPVLIFETSTGNGPLVQRWLQAAPAPMGSSLMYEVYKRMPNGTDFSIFRDAGWRGLNFAAIGGSTDYHTALDRVDRLALGTLQQQGDTMLALARAFSTGPVVVAGPDRVYPDRVFPDRVYFDAPLLGTVSYPGSWALPLALAATLLFVAATVLGRRRGELRATRIGWAMPAFIVQVALVAAACQAGWWCVQLAHPQYKTMLQGDPYNANWYLAAFALLATALFLLLVRWLRRWLTVSELAVGALAWWTIAALATSILLPGASFLFLWPVVFQSVAWLLEGRIKGHAVLQAVALFAVSLLVIPVVALISTALMLPAIAAPAVVGAMLLGLAEPVLALLDRVRFPLVAAVAGVACLAGGALTSGFDADHPQPYSLFLATDANAGKSYWLSGDAAPSPWVRSHLPGAAYREVPGLFGSASAPLWVADAAPQTIAAPVVTVASDSASGPVRHLELVVRSPRAAPTLSLAIDGAPVLAATVEGQVLLGAPQARWRGGLQGFGADPVHVNVTLPSGRAFTLRVKDVSYDLCAAPGMACPPTVVAQPFGFSATIQTVRSMPFAP